MLLLIDAGNTLCKWLSVSVDGRVERGSDSYEDLVQRWSGACGLSRIACSSVLPPQQDQELTHLADKLSVPIWFAQSESSLGGLHNSYAVPGRLGVDRWLAMLAAWHRCGGALCVVDAGTTMTIDIVDQRGSHRGGYIIPGIQMMRDSLFAKTGRVRDSQDRAENLSPGVSTKEAVSRGLQLAHVGALMHVLSREVPKGNLSLFASGGTVGETLGLGGVDACYAPDLVLEGLVVSAGLNGIINEYRPVLEKVKVRP
ncbi:MAG: type III pantothenate kinase [Pseudomonadota bacterium]